MKNGHIEEVTQSHIRSIIYNLNKIAKEDISLEGSNGEMFVLGLVDYMEKEANITPACALSVLRKMAEVGYANIIDRQKSASTYDADSMLDQAKRLDALFDDVENKVATKFDTFLAETGQTFSNIGNAVAAPFAAIPKMLDQGGTALANTDTAKAVQKNIGKGYAEGAVDRFLEHGKKYLSQAWDYMKTPEFLSDVAPWAIGALGGGLLLPALGSKNTLLNVVGGALIGGGIKHMDLMNPEKWKKIRENFSSGVTDPKAIAPTAGPQTPSDPNLAPGAVPVKQ